MLEALRTAIDTLVAADPSVLANAEAIVALHRELSRMEAVTTRATAAFDATGEWQRGGARTAGVWVAYRCNLPKSVAKQRVALGRSLHHLPVASAAWLAGDIASAHVSALAGATTAVTTQAMARDEQMLVDKAKALRFDSFRRVLSYWCDHADPEGSEDKAENQVEARSFHLSTTLGGTWVGDLVLDPVRGAVVSNQLKRIEQELFEADWAEARQRVGDGALATELSRTGTQRRADALVEMARRAGTAPVGGRRPEPLFSVLVNYESFAGRICELADGTVVSPGSLVRWLDEAWIERVVFDGPSRVIDVGVARRLFTGATRRAVEIRDRECFHEFCDVPAEDCQVDHIEPYAAGGQTTTGNGRMACGCHNRGRHRPPPDQPHPPPQE
ncbi:MAG: DUF222 domain-containing protein [Acidimicrobiales bacterium]